MRKIVLVAGYTKSSNLEIIRECFPSEDIFLGCVYTRSAQTETKINYLKNFDFLFDLNQPSDIEKLQHMAEDICLVTCTQERDMDAYIQTLALCGKISPAQEKSYTNVINKLKFKKELLSTNPEIVPNVNVVDDNLLAKLDTLSYPQVIKPSGLAGSILIDIVNSPKEFKKHIDDFALSMRQIGSESYEKEIEVIAEEYITGPQYSVNVYIDAEQKITYSPISRVITPQEMGSNDSYSALQYITNELDTIQFAQLQTAVQKIVEHFNIRNTSAHFDSVLSPQGWKFFEVGLRIGGNRQELYSLSHEMNHFKNDILNRLGKEVVIPEQKNYVCIVQKAAEKTGILKGISYTRNIQGGKPPLIKEAKMSKAGKGVMPLSQGGGTICRFFVWGKDKQEVIESSKELFHSIKFDIS